MDRGSSSSKSNVSLLLRVQDMIVSMRYCWRF